MISQTQIKIITLYNDISQDKYIIEDLEKMNSLYQIYNSDFSEGISQAIKSVKNHIHKLKNEIDALEN